MSFIVATVFEGCFSMMSPLVVGFMLLEPEIVHELHEFFLVFLKNWLIVEFGVVVAKGISDWCVWKSSREKSLNCVMEELESLVVLRYVLW